MKIVPGQLWRTRVPLFLDIKVLSHINVTCAHQSINQSINQKFFFPPLKHKSQGMYEANIKSLKIWTAPLKCKLEYPSYQNARQVVVLKKIWMLKRLIFIGEQDRESLRTLDTADGSITMRFPCWTSTNMEVQIWMEVVISLILHYNVFSNLAVELANRDFGVMISSILVTVMMIFDSLLTTPVTQVQKIYTTSFPCWYRQKADFAGPWEPATHTLQWELTSPVTRPANETTDNTTWRRPYGAWAPEVEISRSGVLYL